MAFVKRVLFAACAVLVCLVFFWERSHKNAQGDAPSPAPPGAYRQRLVAVGDLHGDIDNAVKVLQMADIIDGKRQWKAGNDILVQTGDEIDRGTFALDIYRLFQRLRTEADVKGGRVLSILGNHEYMNALGDWRYVTNADIKHWGGYDQRIADMEAHGWLGAEWLANYTVAAKVAMSPYDVSPAYSFTHGSLSPYFPFLAPFPQKINELGHDLLKRALTPPMAKPHPPNQYEGLPKGTTPEEAELYSQRGPLWARGLAQSPNEELVCKQADQIRDKIGVRRIIGGHTPNFEKIVSRCNGDVIVIDTGISYAYGGILSALEIIYTLDPVKGGDAGEMEAEPGQQRPFVVRGAKSADSVESAGVLHKGKQYHEREEVFAIYADRKQKLADEKRVVTL